MRSLAALRCVLLALLVAAAICGGTAGAVAASTPAETTADASLYAGLEDVGIENASDASLTMDVTVLSHGSASWNVTVWFALDDENDTQAFERLAAEFERGGGEETLSAALFEGIADDVADHAGRPMEITDVSRTSGMTNDTGTLSLEFTWTRFAATQNETVILGDAFVTADGVWLPTLDAGHHLVIRAPSGYAVDSANLPVESGRMHLQGPMALDPDTIGALYVPSSDPPTPPGNGGESVVATGTVGAMIVVLVLALLLFARWRNPLLGERIRAIGGERREDDEPDPADELDDEEAATTDAPTGDENDEELDEDIDLELLSDEERVVRLLRVNGGRMKQAVIVTETDWSNAKVSQLLSSMAEAGTVEKLRIGRENLITLVEDGGDGGGAGGEDDGDEEQSG